MSKLYNDTNSNNSQNYVCSSSIIHIAGTAESSRKRLFSPQKVFEVDSMKNIPRRSRLYRPNCMPHNTASTTSSCVYAPSYTSPTRTRLAEPEADNYTPYYGPFELKNVTNYIDCDDDIQLDDVSSCNYVMEVLNITDTSYIPRNSNISKKHVTVENTVMTQANETRLGKKTDLLQYSSSSTIPVGNIIESKGLSRGRLQNKLKPNSLLTLSFVATAPINTSVGNNVRLYGCTRSGEMPSIVPTSIPTSIVPGQKNDNLIEYRDRVPESAITSDLSEPSYVIYWSSPVSDDIATSNIPSNHIVTSSIPSNDITTSSIPSNDIVTSSIPSNDIVTSSIPSNDIATSTILSVGNIDHLVQPTSLPDSIPSEVIIPISQQIFQISSSLEFPQSLPLSLTKINSSLSAHIGLGKGIRKNPINKEKKTNSNIKDILESFPTNVPIIKKTKKCIVRVFDASSLEKLKFENLEFVLSELSYNHDLNKMEMCPHITDNILIQNEFNPNAVNSFVRATISTNCEMNEKNKENICNHQRFTRNKSNLLIEKNIEKDEKNISQKLGNQKNTMVKKLIQEEKRKEANSVFSFSVIDKRKEDENLPISLANRSRISSTVYTESVTGVTYTTQKIIGKGAFGYAVLAKVSECSSKIKECSSKIKECSSIATSKDETGKIQFLFFVFLVVIFIVLLIFFTRFLFSFFVCHS